MNVERTKITRRSLIKYLLKVGLGAVFLGGSGYSYARYIEPKQLSMTEHIIRSVKIPKSFNQCKMILFSDTHLGFHYSLKQFSQLVDVINEKKPDIILFAGDLMDAPNQCKEIQQITQFLKKLHAPLGKFSIYGNHDHGGYGSEIVKKMMEEASFTLLINEHKKIYNEKKDYIYISGLDDGMLGNPNPKQALEQIEKHVFSILLAHQPDLVNDVIPYPVDLQLSGHSHGGQVQLPFYGPIFTPYGALHYFEGFYQVQKTTLYVNRGIGTTRFPFRFLCPPELTIFTLQSESSSII